MPSMPTPKSTYGCCSLRKHVNFPPIFPVFLLTLTLTFPLLHFTIIYTMDAAAFYDSRSQCTVGLSNSKSPRPSIQIEKKKPNNNIQILLKDSFNFAKNYYMFDVFDEISYLTNSYSSGFNSYGSCVYSPVNLLKTINCFRIYLASRLTLTLKVAKDKIKLRSFLTVSFRQYSFSTTTLRHILFRLFFFLLVSIYVWPKTNFLSQTSVCDKKFIFSRPFPPFSGTIHSRGNRIGLCLHVCALTIAVFSFLQYFSFGPLLVDSFAILKSIQVIPPLICLYAS